MLYCEGCNMHYTDTGCGQLEEHTDCPKSCALCGEPITGRDYGCAGHTIEEARDFVDQKRRGGGN